MARYEVPKMSDFQLDDDDRPVGRVLSRREALALFGGTGAALMTGIVAGSALAQSASPAASAALPACVVVPELTEGPYWVEERLERSDVRTDTATGAQVPGARLDLAWAVTRIDGTACTPFDGAIVDIWHCDSQGVYSGVTDPGFDTQADDFLRGYQRTDANGMARFTTIYPGWYSGRAVHIHFKVRTDPDQSAGSVFTSQLFFDDALTDQVYLAEPYVGRGERSPRNDGDGIFGQSGGQTLATVTPTDEGYAATFAVGLQMS